MAYDWKKLSEYLNLYEDEQICISCPWWFDKAIVRTGKEWLSYFENMTINTINCYDVKYYCDDCSPADWQHYICIN